MPRVPVQKFKFSSLKFRAKVLILSLLCITLTLGAYAGWLFYSSYSQNKEQQAYADAMTQADNFSRNSQPHKTVAVLEAYLKTGHPLDHRYHAMSALAYAYIQNHQDEQAFTQLKQVDALRIKPPSIYVLRSLAWYYLTHNQKSSAISYYRQAISVAESKYDPEATPYLAEWKTQLKQLEAS